LHFYNYNQLSSSYGDEKGEGVPYFNTNFGGLFGVQNDLRLLGFVEHEAGTAQQALAMLGCCQPENF